MERVCVTGATGFIAGHLIKFLLNEGYQVVGTVRDLHHEKLASLKELPHASKNLELKEIPEVSRYEGFVEAFKGCKVLFHLACPVFTKRPDAVQVAIKGTLNACKASLEVGIRRIVLTSSMASILNSSDADGSHIFSEKDWNEDPANDYNKEKVEAERVAWNFVKEHPELELAAIHPALVLGPALGKKLISSTILYHGLHLLDGTLKKKGAEKDDKFAIVSVHDVVEAHYRAMKVSDAKSERFIVSNPEQWNHRKVGQVIKKHFPSLDVPAFEIQESEDLLDKFVDNSKVVELLGHPLKKAEDAIVEMVQSFIDLGVVKVQRED